MQGPTGTAKKTVQMSPGAGKLTALSVLWGPTLEGTDQALAACEFLRPASMLSPVSCHISCTENRHPALA